MSFCENIISVITKSGVLPPAFKITWCGSIGVYVEGVQNLINIKNEEISLLVKGGNLLIKGENLLISSYNDQDMTISGKVLDIKFIKKGEK